MNAALLARLRFIDFLLDHYGSIDRGALIDLCGIGPAQASRDIAAYHEAAPGNTVFDGSSKLYFRSATFTRKFP